jgi:DNA invertase Pin-like site-specific DNA recombinase
MFAQAHRKQHYHALTPPSRPKGPFAVSETCGRLPFVGIEQPKTRVIGYVRVSTDKQEQSPEAQRQRLEAYAVAMELNLLDIAYETKSAKTIADRPVLLAALARLSAGEAEGLLVTKLDRLTRSIRDLGVLLEDHFSKFQLLSVGDSIDTRSASGRLTLNVLISVSQWEREAIGERTKAGMEVLKQQGVSIGQAPFGYHYGPRPSKDERCPLIPVPEEQAAIARARELRAEGLSLLKIAGKLTEEGFRTRNGFWSGDSVRSALLRP